MQEATDNAKIMVVRRAISRAEADQELSLLRERNEVELDRIRGEVEEMIKRAGALNPELVHAISQFGDKAFVEKMMEPSGRLPLPRASHPPTPSRTSSRVLRSKGSWVPSQSVRTRSQVATAQRKGTNRKEAPILSGPLFLTSWRSASQCDA